jgi:hypothetical protein
VRPVSNKQTRKREEEGGEGEEQEEEKEEEKKEEKEKYVLIILGMGSSLPSCLLLSLPIGALLTTVLAILHKLSFTFLLYVSCALPGGIFFF